MKHVEEKPIAKVWSDGEMVGVELVTEDGGRAPMCNRRLAACWNACTGIDTETLEQISDDLNKWTERKYNEVLDMAETNIDLKVQRNGLLDLVKYLLENGSFHTTAITGNGYDSDFVLWNEKAKELIKQIEGEKE